MSRTHPLSEQALAAAWAEGQMMTLDKAIADALALAAAMFIE